jgi:hypothetical protein
LLFAKQCNLRHSRARASPPPVPAPGHHFSVLRLPVDRSDMERARAPASGDPGVLPRPESPGTGLPLKLPTGDSARSTPAPVSAPGGRLTRRTHRTARPRPAQGPVVRAWNEKEKEMRCAKQFCSYETFWLLGGDRPAPAASGEQPLLPGPNATVRARASGGRPPRVASGDSPPAPWLVRERDLARGERAPPTATLRSGAEFWRRRPPLRCKSGDAAPPSGKPAPSASDAAPASFPRSASSPPAFFPRGSGASLIGMSRGRRTFTSVCEKLRPRSRSKIAATGSVLGPTIRALASVGDNSGVMSSPLMLRRVSECRIKPT